MDNWNVDPAEGQDPYAPDCASRAAEGFYVGALYGAFFARVLPPVVDNGHPANKPPHLFCSRACTIGDTR